MIIYRVTNTIDGKVYIGKTVQSMKRRKQCHLAHAKRGCTFYFHRAIKKHGADNFKWEIIATSESKESLGELEKKYISEYKKLNTLYNLTDGGEGVCGRKCSEDTKEKLRIKNKGQIPWSKGRVVSRETREKISRALSNPSEETREKMRKASAGRNVGRKQSAEERLKRSISATGRILTEDERRKISESKIGKPLSEHHKSKLSEITKKQFASKESRLNHSAIMKKYYDGKKAENGHISG